MDNAASTPLNKDVINEMLPFIKNDYGNPSSVHEKGRKVKVAIQNSRKRVARLIGANSSEIFFTSGGTESNNLALKGFCEYLRETDEQRNQIIISTIEHDTILETSIFLKKYGFDIKFLDVDSHGIVEPSRFKNLLNEKTGLVSIMLANNEVGTIQPISELAKITHDFDKNIFFHTDAVQGAGKIPIDVRELDVDSLSISSHKIYGPKGVGALYIKKSRKIHPLIHGGGQESSIRSGTENVYGIVGFGKAAEISLKNLKKNFDYLKSSRDYLIKKILSNISGTSLNGSYESRLPNNVNITFLGVNGEELIVELDEHGIEASTGSACSTNKQKSSHVLKAMGLDYEEISGSIRFSLGIQNTKEELDKTVEILSVVIADLRDRSPFKIKYQ
ncbi:MAG: cysteine desulfurase [Nitrososphaeraceae archaeon]|nr:cysteine desulfurase [Nitrososphaeraceae archaeon]